MASKPAFQKKDGDKDKEELVEELEALRGHCSRLKAVVERYEHADEELSRLAPIVTSSDDAIIGKTLDGIITSWNKSAERLYGYSEAEAVGKHIRIIVPPDHMPELNEILDRIRRGERVDHHETVHATKDGRRIDVSITISPIVDAAGNVIGASTIARDITERKRVEEALRESEEKSRDLADMERQRLFSLLDGLPAFVYLQAPDYSIRFANREFRKTFGEPENRPCYEAIQCNDKPCPDCQTFKVFDTQRPQVWEWTDKRGNIYQIYDYPLRDVDGTPLVLEMGIDITERKRAEEARRESEANLAKAQRITHLGNWEWDVKEDKVFCSDEFYRVFGLDRRDYITYGQFIDTLYTGDRDRVNRAVEAALYKGESYSIDYCVVWPGGSEHIIHAEGEVTYSPGGEPIKMFGTVQDITDRKKAEDALRESERKFKAIFNQIFQFLGLLAVDGTLIEANMPAMEYIGVREQDVIGKPFWDTPWWRHSAELQNRLKEAVKLAARGKLVRFETTHPASDGSLNYFDFSIKPVAGESGDIVLLIAESRDITERKKAEEAQRANEEKFRALADNIPVMAWMANADGEIFWFNKQCYDFTGVTMEEMQGRGWQKALQPDYSKAVTEEWSTSINEGKPFYGIFPMKGKDGSYRWFLTRVTPIKDKNGKIQRWFGTNTDITERKRAEEELRASEEKFRVLADTSFDIIMVHRGDNLLYVNNPAVGLTGYSKDEILKMRFWELFTEDVRETIKKRAFDRLAGKSVPTSYETTILSKDGQTKWINMTAGIFLFEGKPTIIATLFDITGIKNTEKELKEAKAQAELYLDLMGHDIRNMNQVSMGFLEFALESPNIDKKDKELLLKTMGGLENSTRLIDNVSKLQKSQKGELKLHAVDACQAILRVLGHYSNMPGVDATFNYELPPGCMVMANDLLYEIFENLVGNSIKHAGPRPTISIKYETTMLNGKDYNRFIVEDNGSGIPDDLKPNIFTRRLRSGAKTRGSGLGLFIVKSLVESYDGLVLVEDRVPGDYSKGARFVVMLPAIEG